ncbi:DUF4179 domain-containing protein [Bacillus sp. FJAT-42376]|uniref:DUF4179 domain-containing protein n=1 Tax=Bacillus sp. FJAT-42376 TaxID=2014076 RepID=UPI000F4E3AA0|nr:DUF4179 domain-containing protein [Bacillus sp. FJAT-42376]AZB41749.1 DUF4179 domain-containing protein [Bacillus sp. FJAT-42376]
MNKFKEQMDQTEFGSMKFDKVDQLAVMKEVRETQNRGRKRKKKFPSVILTTMAAAAILFVLLMQSPIKDQIEAGKPKPNTLLSQSNDPGLVAWSQKNDPQKVNQTSESSGIKVTIKEIMYDGYRMAIGYEVQSKTKFVGPVHNPKITVNGKGIDVSDTTDSVESQLNAYEKEAHSFSGVTSFFIKEKLPEKFEVKLQFYGNQNLMEARKTAAFDKARGTKGNWAFSIPVDKKGEIYTIKPKKSVTKDATKLSVDKVILAPSVTEVTAVKESKGKDAFKGSQYRILDDKGNLLAGFGDIELSGEEKNGKSIFRCIGRFAPADGIPSYIAVQPFTYNDAENNPDQGKITVKRITDPLPMVFPQNDKSIVVNKIEESKDKKRLKIYYEVKGDLPELRIRFFHLTIGNYESESRKDLLDQNLFKNITSNENEKVAEFNTGLRNDLYLSSPNVNPVLYKEMELKIPINKKDLIKK